MHYGEIGVRRAVPLALALLCASYPKTSLMETLSKYSHDHDQETAMSAILALGVVGAGTNNARLGQMLRQLASYYHRDPDMMFILRISQGLVHMGKGILSLSPLHTDRQIVNKSALTSLMTVMVAGTSMKDVLINGCPILIYTLVPALFPRFLMTLSADTMEPVGVSVRVGQAVDVVGQAGRPKTITGFQTHSTPVVLSFLERAEMATEKCKL